MSYNIGFCDDKYPEEGFELASFDDVPICPAKGDVISLHITHPDGKTFYWQNAEVYRVEHHVSVNRNSGLHRYHSTWGALVFLRGGDQTGVNG